MPERAAIVTGAARGIGLALAEVVARIESVPAGLLQATQRADDIGGHEYSVTTRDSTCGIVP